jgi:hypothetical protein
MTRTTHAAIALAASLLAAAPALAQSRPSTTAMSCAQAQGTVKSAGAIVLGTGDHAYERFASGQAFCTSQEVALPVWAPTRDVAQCFVGYVCEDRSGRDATRQ